VSSRDSRNRTARRGGQPCRASLRLEPLEPRLLLSAGFVGVDGTGFVLDGEPFYAPGTNCYYLMQFAADPALRPLVDEVLEDAADMGLKTLRTWAFYDGDEPNALQTAPGVYNETTFVGLDYVVARAADYDIRLILPLVNDWADYGGMDQYVAWDALYGTSPGTASDRIDFYTDPDTVQWYQDHVAAVLNRVNTLTGVAYKNDPTIMAWELANEPRGKEGWPPDMQPLQGWIEDMAAYVKTVDTNHLLTTGVEGFYAYRGTHWLYSGWMGADFVVNHNVAGIDFATCHVWPQNWGISNADALDWVDDHIADAHNTLGMPLLIEEFGQFRTTDDPWNTWVLYHDRYPDFDHYGVYYPDDVDTVTLIAAAASNGPGGFTIEGSDFYRWGAPTFLQILSYQPLEPGQDSTDPISLTRIEDDLCRLAAFQDGDDPVVLRVYAQPTATLSVRMPQEFYDGVRELGFWVIRDIWFEPDYTASDAVAKGQAAIDAVINEVQTVAAFDRIFAWEFANEFQADTAVEIAALESFLTDMCAYLKQQVTALPVSDWVTWASWPPSDPLHTDGNPIVLDCWDFHGHNVYSYEPDRIRDHQAGPATGTPFAGYLAALADAYADRGLDKPLVLSETGYPDSPMTVPSQSDYHPWAPQYTKGELSSEVVAEALANRYWDARLSGTVDGFALFEWNDEWWKAGDPTSQGHPEEYFGVIGFDPDTYEAVAKLQFDTVQTLYTLTWTDGLISLSADATSLGPDGATTLRATVSPDLDGPYTLRWETSRGVIVGDGEAVEFYAGGTALGDATVTAIVCSADGEASLATLTLGIQPSAAAAIEALTLGRDVYVTDHWVRGVASGRVTNVSLDDYKVAVYIETDQRYPQPYGDMLDIFVQADGYWWTPVSNHNDGELHAFLVPVDYEPVALPAGTDPAGAVAGASLTAMSDSDNDLLDDNWEELHFGAANLAEGRHGDPDGDLANNLEEQLAGTLPATADNDSDDDGLHDNWERRYFGRLAYDADDDPEDDGLDNAAELALGTHPGRTAIDADRDGLPDAWETRHFGGTQADPADPLPGGTTVLEAYQLGRPLPVESVVLDTRTTIDGSLNPDAPGARSVTLLDIEAHGNPDSTLYAIQIGDDPDAGWLRFDNSGGPLFRDDLAADGTQPEWHTAAEWSGCRLRGLDPDTDYTLRAVGNTGFCPDAVIVEAAALHTNRDGDVNGSGLASGLDYALAKVGVLLGEAIHGRWHWSYDVNDDGVLDALDLGLIWNAALTPPPDVAAAGDASAVTAAALAAAMGGGSGQRIYAATSGVGRPLRIVRQAVTPAARLTAVWSSDDSAQPWEPPGSGGDGDLYPPSEPIT